LIVVPFYKKMLSYLYPVSIWKGEGTQNPFLELLLYQNQYQLATKDALYSDGNRYRPLVLAFNEIGREISSVKKVLVLGTGLGSAVQILRSKNLSPSFIMVDNDKKVLELAQHMLHRQKNISFICTDANEFISKTKDTYDLLIVDVFRSRIVPGSIIARAFLEKCRQAITEGKYLVLNYIITDEEEWTRALENINSVFPGNKILNNGINRIVIARV
jgi:spermidine synthase